MFNSAAKNDNDSEDQAMGLLSNELLKLSCGDRNAIQEEMHGVRCLAPEETPDLVSKALHDFEFELQSIPATKKETYLNLLLHQFGTANSEQQHYMNDFEFRLRFLRCELFDAKKAALRFVNYLNFVNASWGFEVVSSKRVITLEHLGLDDKRFLKKGYVQLLHFRDVGGRRISITLGKPDGDAVKAPSKTLIKCLFYMMDVASRDSAESQRKGIVTIFDSSGILSHMHNIVKEIDLLDQLSDSIPTRIVANHNFCPKTSKGFEMISKMLLSLHSYGIRTPNQHELRQNFHFCSTQVETKYVLQGYGIPIDYYPLTDSGTIKTKQFHEWLKLRSALEEGDAANQVINCFKSDKNYIRNNVVECPCLDDVVFRPGRSATRGNPGNKAFREFIAERLRSKMMAWITPPSPSDATAVSLSSDSDGFVNSFSDKLVFDSIIDEIQRNHNGRFLRWDNDLHVCILMNDREEIAHKLSIYMYNFKKRWKYIHQTLGSTSSSTAALISELSPAATEPIFTPEDRDVAYDFITSGRPPPSRFDCLPSGCDCISSSPTPSDDSSVSGRKRGR